MPRVSVLPFEPESFLFPSISRLDTKEMHVYVLSETQQEMPATEERLVRSMYRTRCAKSISFEHLIKWFAMLLIRVIDDDSSARGHANAKEEIGDEFPSSLADLKETISSANRFFDEWLTRPLLSFKGLLPEATSEDQPGTPEFRHELLMLILQMMRSDASRFYNTRRRSNSSTEVVATFAQIARLVRQVTGAAVTRYKLFRARYETLVTSASTTRMRRVNSNLRTRCETDAILRSALSLGHRYERLRQLSCVPGMHRNLLCCFPAWSTALTHVLKHRGTVIPAELRKKMIAELNRTVKMHRLKDFREQALNYYRENCATKDIALLASLYHCRRLLHFAAQKETE
eukprot:gene171-305_t